MFFHCFAAAEGFKSDFASFVSSASQSDENIPLVLVAFLREERPAGAGLKLAASVFRNKRGASLTLEYLCHVAKDLGQL